MGNITVLNIVYVFLWEVVSSLSLVQFQIHRKNHIILTLFPGPIPYDGSPCKMQLNKWVDKPIQDGGSPFGFHEDD